MMTTPTTKDPARDWTLEQWKDWVRDHVDIHLGTVVLDARLLLEVVLDRDSARDQVTRIQKLWDDERQRL